jgi:hypothetical protein
MNRKEPPRVGGDPAPESRADFLFANIIRRGDSYNVVSLQKYTKYIDIVRSSLDKIAEIVDSNTANILFFDPMHIRIPNSDARHAKSAQHLILNFLQSAEGEITFDFCIDYTNHTTNTVLQHHLQNILNQDQEYLAKRACGVAPTRGSEENGSADGRISGPQSPKSAAPSPSSCGDSPQPAIVNKWINDRNKHMKIFKHSLSMPEYAEPPHRADQELDQDHIHH